MIIEKRRPLKNGMPPIHPGETMADDLTAMGMSPAEFDAAIAVPPGTTALLLAACIDVTPELALRLSRYLCTTPQLWLNLQASYELKVVARKHGQAIAAQVRPLVDYGSIPLHTSDVRAAAD